MKTDLYTKVVLTIIAALLALHLVGTDGFFTKAYGETTPPGHINVPLNADGSINVKVVQDSEPKDVFIVGWKSGYIANGELQLSRNPNYLPKSNDVLSAIPFKEITH